MCYSWESTHLHLHVYLKAWAPLSLSPIFVSGLCPCCPFVVACVHCLLTVFCLLFVFCLSIGFWIYDCCCCYVGSKNLSWWTLTNDLPINIELISADAVCILGPGPVPKDLFWHKVQHVHWVSSYYMQFHVHVDVISFALYIMHWCGFNRQLCLSPLWIVYSLLNSGWSVR